MFDDFGYDDDPDYAEIMIQEFDTGYIPEEGYSSEDQNDSDSSDESLSDHSDSEDSQIQVRDGFDLRNPSEVEQKLHERILNKIRHDKNFFTLFGQLYRQNRIAKFNEYRIKELESTEPSKIGDKNKGLNK